MCDSYAIMASCDAREFANESDRGKVKAPISFENGLSKALESYISLHINAISQKMQLFPKSICYGKSYRQLGCCRAKDQSVRFSLRLALMPYFCIDSVIIHELAHLRYPHHGQDFWNLVRTFDDNPQGIQEWLQANYSLNARLYQKIFK